jgi:hypothetical protein
VLGHITDAFRHVCHNTSVIRSYYRHVKNASVISSYYRRVTKTRLYWKYTRLCEESSQTRIANKRLCEESSQTRVANTRLCRPVIADARIQHASVITIYKNKKRKIPNGRVLYTWFMTQQLYIIYQSYTWSNIIWFCYLLKSHLFNYMSLHQTTSKPICYLN